MKIAFCLYGQPRNYKKGYEVFSSWLKFNNIKFDKDVVDQEVDFFFHAWTLKPGQKYKSSTYRNIPNSELNPVDINVMESDLLELYHPVKYMFELQKSTSFFPVEHVKKSIAYHNIESQETRDCVPNVLSQLYSLAQVHNLCKSHVEETGIVYDCIIVSRFDFQNSLNRIRLSDWDYSKKTILVENHYPRKLINGSFIIMPPSVFFVWMKMYRDLDSFINNRQIVKIMNNIRETWHFNTEEIYTASYLYYFKNHDNIVYIYPSIKFYKI